MKRATIVAWGCLPVFLGLMAGVVADSWTCQQGDLSRHVLIFYPEPPARLPCKVFYSKPRENVVPRALWEAAYDQDFCERKAAEFVAQLESWGWACRGDQSPQRLDEAFDKTIAPE